MTNLPAYLIVYDVLSFTSALVLAITVLTVVCSKRLYRGKAWFGMMTCWLVYSLSYGLLVGKQIGPEPSFAHCFIQTLFIYAAPPLVAVGTLCFYIDFYLGSCWDPSRRRPLRPKVAYFILVLPWLVHIAIDVEVIIAIVTSTADPVVKRLEHNLYCHINGNAHAGLVSAVIVVCSMVLLIPLEVWTGMQLYRCRSVHAGEDFWQYLTVYLRIAACTVIAATAFGLSAIYIADSHSDSVVEDLSFPSVSMAVSLIFASQQDLLNVWLCRSMQRSRIDRSVPRSTDLSIPEDIKHPQNKWTLQLVSSNSSQ